MTGHETKLDVYLGKNIIAHLSLIENQISFEYTSDWKKSGYAVSPHLPLMEPIPTRNIEWYLQNLLPEGDMLTTITEHLQLSKYNTLGLIRALGQDTAGALSFLPHKQTPSTQSSFKLITPEEIESRLKIRDQHNLIVWDKKPRLSMAGIQDKLNVVIDANRCMGFGEGKLCSTHLLKFEKKQLSHLVLNEYITMQLAARCGLSVAKCDILRFGKYPALLVERFDRKRIHSNEIERKQVIDGCQALNLPPEYKYERNFGSGRDVKHVREGASLLKLFNFAKNCANPAETKGKMLDWVLFNLLTNNYDAHGKNISFFVTQNGIALTPFYDLVNIKLYPQFENEIAMAIGDDFDGETIGAYQLAEFAHQCKLSRSLVAKQLTNLATALMDFTTEPLFSEIVENTAEKNVVKQYHRSIQAQCQHLLSQAKKMSSVVL